jgi:hypothetical protein
MKGVELLRALKGCFGTWKVHVQWGVAYNGNYFEGDNM